METHALFLYGEKYIGREKTAEIQAGPCTSAVYFDGKFLNQDARVIW